MLNHTDINLPPIYPFTGKFYPQTFKSIILLLCQNVFLSFSSQNKLKRTWTQAVIGESTDDPIKYIIQRMAFEKFAVIGSVRTGKTRIDLNKRICHRRTFGSNVVSKFEKLLISEIKLCASKLPVSPNDIRFDPTHGDILFYEEGGKFDNHRDTVSEFPFGENNNDMNGDPVWRMYTLLIGFSSNINNMAMVNDGNTVIYLPSRTFVPYSKICDKTINNMIYGRKLIQHSFAEGCMQSHFLIFPAEALHSSIKIQQKGGYKLALKFDLWVKMPQITSDNLYQVLRIPSSHYCQCRICEPGKLRLVDCYKILGLYYKSKNLPEHLWCVISEYLVDVKKYIRCICNNNCPCCCTCDYCMLDSTCNGEYDEYEYDYDYGGPTDECNGYED